MIASLIIIAFAVWAINLPLLRKRKSGHSEEFGEVVNVVDGDTIDVSLRGRIERIRMILVDAPELGTRAGEDARKRLKSLLQGRMVKLVRDKRDSDRYGRKLRYVYAGRTFVNAWLVRSGLARIMKVYPNTTKLKDIE